jgi:hypothetical protein
MKRMHLTRKLVFVDSYYRISKCGHIHRVSAHWRRFPLLKRHTVAFLRPFVPASLS